MLYAMTLYKGKPGKNHGNDQSGNPSSKHWFDDFKKFSDMAWNERIGRRSEKPNPQIEGDEIYMKQGPDGVFVQGPTRQNFGVPDDMREQWQARRRHSQKGFLARSWDRVAKKEALKDFALGAGISGGLRWAVIGAGTAVGLSGTGLLLVGSGVAAAVGRTAYTMYKDHKTHNAESHDDVSFWEYANSNRQKYIKSFLTSSAFSTLGSTFATYALPHLEPMARPVIEATKEYAAAAFVAGKELGASMFASGKEFASRAVSAAKEQGTIALNSLKEHSAPFLNAAKTTLSDLQDSWDKNTARMADKATEKVASLSASAASIATAGWDQLKQSGASFSRWASSLFGESKPVVPPVQVPSVPEMVPEVIPESAAPAVAPMTQADIQALFNRNREPTVIGDYMRERLASPAIAPETTVTPPSATAPVAPEAPAVAPVETPAEPAVPVVVPELTIRDKIAALVEDGKPNKRWAAIAERAMDGDAQATKDIAQAVLNGTNGFGRNAVAAAELYRDAAAAGNKQAIADLAFMTFHGLGDIKADKIGAIVALSEMPKNSYVRTMLQNLTGEGAVKKTVSSALNSAAEGAPISARPVVEVIVPETPEATSAASFIPPGEELKVVWQQTAEGNIEGSIEKKYVKRWMEEAAKEGTIIWVPTAHIQ